jgi:processive 1,2-diacylglycerol beta-glucosyltransferase
MKVLIFPLLQMPSGHHQVADAVARWLEQEFPDVEIHKLELLSLVSPTIERIISQTYLKWIHHFPNIYDFIYRQIAYESRKKKPQYKGFEPIFLKKMRDVIRSWEPHLIICTHCFPSYLCNRLKSEGECDVPVINIYTDYFINQVWGKENIEFHFVPHRRHKEELLKQGVHDENVFVTGIPVDRIFHAGPPKKNRSKGTRPNLLIAGGSNGVGLNREIFDQLREDNGVDIHILCGKNQKLFRFIADLGVSHLIPIPYLSSREEMNRLYEKVDAVITKPGGVTVSECLNKRLPIFIHSALPGQEEINRRFLNDVRFVYDLDQTERIDEQIIRILRDEQQLEEWEIRIGEYLDTLEWKKALVRMGELLL